MNLENSQISLFGSTSASKLDNEYFFIISPNDKIKEDVKFLKHKIGQKIPKNESLHSIAHISLASIFGNNDAFIINKINSALLNQKSFLVSIKGCEIFQHGKVSKSLVLKVENSEILKSLYTLLYLAFNLKDKRITPHITIAKSILLDDFDKIKSNLEEYDYQGDFFCDRVTLLRRHLNGSFTLIHETILK